MFSSGVLHADDDDYYHIGTDYTTVAYKNRLYYSISVLHTLYVPIKTSETIPIRVGIRNNCDVFCIPPYTYAWIRGPSDIIHKYLFFIRLKLRKEDTPCKIIVVHSVAVLRRGRQLVLVYSHLFC